MDTKSGCLPFLLLLLFPLLASSAVSIRRFRQWNTGFEGEVCAKANSKICSLTGTMKFSLPVKSLNGHNFDATSNTITRNVGFKGKSWYRDFSSGTDICLRFNGQKARPNRQIKVRDLIFNSQCSGGGGSATTKAQTTRRTTRNTARPTRRPTTQGNTTPKGSSGSGRYDFAEVLDKSILFYEAQRSGPLPADNRISWRYDSTLDDGQDHGVDLTGGWFDAGDHVKFNFPMAWSTTVLAWGLNTFKAGYKAAGQLANMYDSIRWPLDYFLKCWDSKNQIYWAQVGDGHVDHSEWTRAENLTKPRPSYAVSHSKPGSDVAGETAAAFAAASIAFKTEDKAYSSRLLTNAKSLFDFAIKYTGTYDSSVPAWDFYRSWSRFDDELCWAAAWLYKATKDTKYKNIANRYLSKSVQTEFSWDNKNIGCQVLMYSAGSMTKDAITGFMNKWMTQITKTPKCGLAWLREWSPLRYSANAALIGLMAAEEKINPAPYREWALSQIDYMLGSNEKRMSYVVGFGTKFPRKIHHRGSSCSKNPTVVCNDAAQYSSSPNPNILIGALVGGPNQYGDYTDARDNYRSNEVACDYNAGFQSAVAGFINLQTRNINVKQINKC